MKDRGFTLIEVLVVIAVIALLLTIAVPVLQKSKDQGKSLVCTSNLRQLALAISVYAEEKKTYPQGFCGNPDCHPSISPEIYKKLNTDPSLDWQMSWWWFHFLTDIIKDDFSKDSILSCPSKNVMNSIISDNILCGNYGINYAICKISITSTEEFCGIPLRPDQVKSPSGKLLLMDSGYALISWKAFIADASSDPTTLGFELPTRQNSYYLPRATVNHTRYDNGSINPFQQEDAVKGRHLWGKVNVAFADGHVDKKSAESIEPAFNAEGDVASSSSWSP